MDANLVTLAPPSQTPTTADDVRQTWRARGAVLAPLLAAAMVLSVLPASGMILLRFPDHPEVQGASVVQGYEGWIPLESGSFGADRDLDPLAINGLTGVTMRMIGLTKPWDNSSTKLLAFAISGTGIGDAEIHWLESGTDPKAKVVPYAKLLLTNAFVKSFAVGGNADDRPQEDFELWFNRFDFTWINPAAGAGQQTVYYDVVTGKSGTSSGTVNTAPTISVITDQQLQEGGSLMVPFTIADAETAATSLTVTATSNNPTLLPAGSLQTGGTGGNRTLTVTPETNQSGTATITVRVSDGATSQSRLFQLVVSPVNDPPLVVIPPQTGVTAGTDKVIGGVTINDIDAGGSDLRATFTVSAGTLTLDDAGSLAGKVAGNGSAEVVATASAAALQSALAGASGLVFRSAANFLGNVTLTIQVDDLGHTGTGPTTGEASAVIEVLLDPYLGWLNGNFSSAELAVPEVSGPTADADGDGRLNLVEYLLGGNPRAGGGEEQLVATSVSGFGGKNYLTLTFQRRSADSDPLISATVEMTVDPADWEGAAVPVQVDSTTPLGNGFERVVVRSTVATEVAPVLFARLSVRR